MVHLCTQWSQWLCHPSGAHRCLHTRIHTESPFSQFTGCKISHCHMPDRGQLHVSVLPLSSKTLDRGKTHAYITTLTSNQFPSSSTCKTTTFTLNLTQVQTCKCYLKNHKDLTKEGKKTPTQTLLHLTSPIIRVQRLNTKGH